MSANGAYNHRTVPNSRGIRFSEAVDVVKREFELLSNERDDLRAQTEEYESRMKLQLNDINAVRRSLTELENKQSALRSQYEGEIRRLRTELTTLTRPASHGPPGIPGFNPLTTPRLGPAPPPHPGVAEGYGQPTGARDPRGATATALIDRGKDSRDKPRGLTPPDSETEWERRQKVVRERANSFRDNDRLADTRDAKRLKSDSGTPYSGPATIPSSQQPREASSSRGDYQVTLPPINTNLSGPATGSPHRPPQIHIPGSAPPPVEDLNLQSVGPEYRKEATDWFVVFNPRVKRSLDINLMHNLMHSSVVCCVQFSSDGKYLATGCNRTAQIFDVKTGNKITVLDDPTVGQGGDLYIRSVRFSPDGKLLATGAEDRVIRIWDIQKKRIITTFDGHQQEIYSLDFSSSGHILASGSGDRTARIWDIKDGSCKVLTITDSDEGLNPNNPSGAAGGADAGVTSVAISPDGRYVAAGSLDTIVRIWDVITGKLVERLVGHKDSVYSVGFTPDGRGLVSGSLDKTLKYWDVSGLVVDAGRGKRDSLDVGKKFGSGSSSPCVMDFAGHKDYVLSVAVSKDGHWVVSGSKDRCVQFWDSRNAALQFMLQGHKNSVISLDINSAGMQPGNGILATGSGDNLARIWQYNVI